MAGSAESVEQVWLLRRVVTVCWLAAGSVLAGRASGGVSRVSYTTEYYDLQPSDARAVRARRRDDVCAE